MVARKNRRWDEMDKTDTALEALYKTFELYKRSEGLSDRTVVWYQEKLREYLRWLLEHGHSTKLSDFTIDLVREFELHLQTKETKHERNPFVPTKHERLSGHTIRGYVRTLKVFSSFLFEEGYTDQNLLQRLKMPKARKVEPEWLRQDEIERLLDIFDRKTTTGSRDYAMVVTFLDTGVRCSELCTLTLDRADLDIGELKVLGKGNKERTVPVGVRAVRALRRYRDHFRPPVEDPHFFLTIDGKPFNVMAVETMIRRAKRLAAIPRLHVHLLRHTFAIHYLMAGGDVFSLQKILGHTTLEVTRIYVNMVSSQVKEKHRLYSPMDNMTMKNDRAGKKPVREGVRLWRIR